MSCMMMTDREWMSLAIALAHEAEVQGEVPVGAVLVHDNQLIGSGFNQVITLCDPSAHAEILAMRDAGQSVKNYRLIDTTLYITLEPCTMCLGAIMHGRVKRVVYGASDRKTGACGGSSHDLTQHPTFFHKLEVEGPIMQDACGALLTEFFKKRRSEHKQ